MVHKELLETRIERLANKIKAENAKSHPDDEKITRWGNQIVRLGKRQYLDEIRRMDR